MSYYVEIRKLLFLLYSCLCLFQISLNTNTFKQEQKKPSLLSFLHSSHLPLCVPSQSTDISVSRPSEVMRTLIDQLFQQEMRGHLSEACLNSDLYGYRVVPGQPFTWRPNCVAYSSRRESYFPTRSWSPRCSLHASSWMYKETWVYSLYVLRLLLCCLCTHRQFVLLNLPKTSRSLIWKIIL